MGIVQSRDKQRVIGGGRLVQIGRAGGCGLGYRDSEPQGSKGGLPFVRQHVFDEFPRFSWMFSGRTGHDPG